MSFVSVPLIIRYIITIVFFALFTAAVLDMCIIHDSAQKKSQYMIPLISIFMLFFVFEMLLMAVSVNTGDHLYEQEASGGLPALPSWIVFSDLIIVTAMLIPHIIFSHRKTLKHTNLMSIKEGIDKLDSGVCYYYEDGVVKLINPLMDELSVCLSGTRVLNGETFNLIAAEHNNSLRTKDGRVWQFTHKRLRYGKGYLYELIASDVTTEDRLLQELREKEIEQENFNRRLKEYGTTVDEITVQREILDAKIHIHDELGKVLLMTKRYIKDGMPDEAEEERIKEIWKKTMLLESPEEFKVRNESVISSINDAAAALGLKVIIEGDMGALDKREVNMLMAGARESLTNSFKHAGASELYIKVRSVKNGRLIEYTDNGHAPDGPVKIGGGLSSLRRYAEENGCFTEIYTDDKMVLRIVIPS